MPVVVEGKDDAADHDVTQASTARSASTRWRAVWLVVVLGIVVALAALSVSVGSRVVGFDDIIAGLGGSAENVDQAAVVKRVPRTILALLVGAALAMSGGVMQGVTRNPLADPGILGVNTGAALAVVVGIAFFGIWRFNTMILVAIVGGSVVAVFVYVIGSLGRGGATPLKLALSGTAVAIVLSSLISAIVLPRGDIAGTVRSWQIGGVGGANYDAITAVAPFLLVGAVICLLSARSLNALALGDDLAAGLGEKVILIRIVSSLGAVMLCSAATAVCGPIGFVGLVVPHLARLLVGSDNRWLLPFSALGGAALLCAADVLGRVIARPEEVAVGVITAFVGAPFFIYFVRRRKVREL